ncbi:MAG: hypothetical protein RL060_690, partial [Bacteroidota bacterium]
MMVMTPGMISNSLKNTQPTKNRGTSGNEISKSCLFFES